MGCLKICRILVARLLAVFSLIGCLAPTVAAGDTAYTMRFHNGVVAVWDHDHNTWLLHTDMPEAMLPEADRALLQRGLHLPNDAALTQALEDFCS